MLIIKNAEDLDSQRGGLRLAAPRDFDSQPWCRESSSPALWVEVLFWRGKSRSLWTKLRIQLKLNTALLSTFRASVTGVTSHISHIYKGINAMLIIRGPIKPCIFWIKIILAIFLAKTRPDKAIFSDLTIDFDFELSKIYMLNPHCLLCLVYMYVLQYKWRRRRRNNYKYYENDEFKNVLIRS